MGTDGASGLHLVLLPLCDNGRKVRLALAVTVADTTRAKVCSGEALPCSFTAHTLHAVGSGSDIGCNKHGGVGGHWRSSFCFTRLALAVITLVAAVTLCYSVWELCLGLGASLSEPFGAAGGVAAEDATLPRDATTLVAAITAALAVVCVFLSLVGICGYKAHTMIAVAMDTATVAAKFMAIALGCVLDRAAPHRCEWFRWRKRGCSHVQSLAAALRPASLSFKRGRERPSFGVAWRVVPEREPSVKVRGRWILGHRTRWLLHRMSRLLRTILSHIFARSSIVWYGR